MNFIDSFLNRVTMYRLVLYYLVVLVLAAFGASFFGVLPFTPEALALSGAIILGICFVTNWVFAKVFSVAANVESVYITAFILLLIITPVTTASTSGVGFLVFASVWAIASKYLLAFGKKHVFNPAAFGVALSALVIAQSASWWVGGNYYLLPVVLVGGLLVVRKLRRFDMVAIFAATSLLTTILTSPGGFSQAQAVVTQTLTLSPFFFLAFVMLTEPLTSPQNRWMRIVYGAFVGVLFAPNIHVGTFYTTPELALLAGNIFAYAVSPKGRYVLTLTAVERMANDVYDFVWSPDRKFGFTPGQYVEWTLGHDYPDARGNRRYFTLASAPTEQNIRLGVKMYPSPSSFKRTLAALKVGDTISVSQLAGSFVLPKNKSKKLVFIAGGIGVTPFRSQVQSLLDTHEKRDIVMLYANKTAADVAYKPIFDQAKAAFGMKTIFALSDEKSPVPDMTLGLVDAAMIMREVPDFKDREFYISGPHGMVEAFKKTLIGMGVSRFKITSDFFPGFA